MSFNVGYINPVTYKVPHGIDVKVDKQDYFHPRRG